jgi:quinol monooxygenase YgiN
MAGPVRPQWAIPGAKPEDAGFSEALDVCLRARWGDVDVPKFAVIGSIEVTPGSRDRFLPLLMAHRARCLRDEPGTLQFEVLLPRDDETKVLLYEVYRDEAAFTAHWNGCQDRGNKVRAGRLIQPVAVEEL